MGLFDFLFKDTIFTFKPDFSKSEYDNWLEFLSKGGTDAQWKTFKKENKWKFPKSKTEKFMEYDTELRPVANKYLELSERIKRQWSDLYKSKNYNSKLASNIEKECYGAISYFEQMQIIDQKHNQQTMNGSPVYTKLALLYERRGDYEKGIEVCKMAIKVGMSEYGRMEKLIKKAGRTPTPEEQQLLETSDQ